MASHAFDDLDAFFDFDQLEHDHGIRTVTTPCQQHDDPSVHPGQVLSMDWVADAPHVLASPDFHTHNFIQKASYPQTCSYEIRHDGDAGTYPLPRPDYEDASASQDATSDQNPRPYIAPSSSSQMHSPGLGSPGRDIAADLHDEKDLVLHPTPTAIPLRQASTASWKPASAKRKGAQSRIPLEARQILEDEFAANPYPCSWEIDIIAHQANLDVKKVRNWFNNTRARKKGGDVDTLQQEHVDAVGCLLGARLSRDSLGALEQQGAEDVQPPQPLAVYLAQSYQEEAVQLPDVQAALETDTLSGSADFHDAWLGMPRGRNGSIITSVDSSDGTAPTSFTVSSSGSRSNISSFGRDRRRGRRRMAWKESPHNNRAKFNGVNSSGEPQKDLAFFCTFCPRAFKTKYEWVRHEDSVHALRTTWICCDTKAPFLQTCPFCGHMHPDDAHMAGHKYQQCSNKPESQRTFYRRDHFIQHLHHIHFANAKHPSVRVGCQARLMATEGHNFGCKDLAMRWRRFGAPMKRDDPMLHCGMCGKRSKDWSERCEHVAQHLVAREHDRSAWWPERKENHLENLYSASPFESFRCRYCLKVFTDVKEMNAHSHCKVWSCRFLRTFDDVTANNAGPPLCSDFPSAKAHHCHLCGAGYRTPHAEHAQNYHRHRSCNQEFYTSEDAFLAHLHNFHNALHPALLHGSSVIEQNFLRNKGASFEPVEFNESWQPCLMDLDDAPIGFAVDKASTPPSIAKKGNGHIKKPTPVRQKIRHDLQRSPIATIKAQRQRSETNTSGSDSHSPRFLRLSTFVPFWSSRIFYSRSNRPYLVPKDNTTVLEEIQKPHVASLVMSSGLVGMALTRWLIKPQHCSLSGMTELIISEDNRES
ncbi:hypothetical protein HBI74_184880 [Parastagonospora nodorum]|nr:hypothetical protein HBI74_184880 [Parastagonospora nodorum]